MLKLHIEFLRPCAEDDSTITVSVLRSGTTSSTLQLQLTQHGKLKVFALATSTNFDQDRDLGPSANPAWTFHPPQKPTPDFAAVVAHQPEPNWIPIQFHGEILPYSARVLGMYPRGGFPVDGIADGWYGFHGDELMDASYLALMTDSMPSMADTMLRTGGLYDANTISAEAETWAEENPGLPLGVENTFIRALASKTFNTTVTFDIQFVQRLPEEGIKWIYSRTTVKSMRGGRLDFDVALYDEQGGLVCSSQQLVFVLDTQRKFRDHGGAARI